MATLNLPPFGPVYVDANVLIYSVEKIDPYWPLLQPMWQAVQHGHSIVSSELVILETLVKPRKDGNSILESTFRQVLFGSRDMQLIPISVQILDQAASLRATNGLKPPDAIHAATALSISCALFVTNDPAFKRINTLPVAVLRDLL